jgi:hypothetical protein
MAGKVAKERKSKEKLKIKLPLNHPLTLSMQALPLRLLSCFFSQPPD